jgi:plastocyanin
MGMRTLRTPALLVVVLFTLGLGLASCGGSSSSSTSSSTTGGAATTTGGAATTAAGAAASGGAVAIHNFAFQPMTLSAKVGDSITVTNQDNTSHSLTANDGSFDTGVFSSGSKTVKLTKAGTFTFHCQIHSFMTGTITVT